MNIEDIKIQPWDVNLAQSIMDAFLVDEEGIEIIDGWQYLPYGDCVYYFKEGCGAFAIDYIDSYIDVVNSLSSDELEALSC